MADEGNVTVARETFDLHTRAATLLDKLLRDPKTARQAEDLVKSINPSAQFPHRDLADSYAAPIKAEAEAARKEAKEALDALKAFKEEQDEARRVADFTARLSKAEQKYGFDEKARDSVLQRMRDQNNPDVESASAFVYESLPKAPPVNGRNADNFLPSKVDLFGSVSRDDQWKKLHESPQQYFDDEVRAVLADQSLV